jgi:formylglycine-generating enzyme required for sulfatase activity
MIQLFQSLHKGLLIAACVVTAAVSLLGCSQGVRTSIDPIDGKVMVQVQAGDFRMGTSPAQVADLATKLHIRSESLSAEIPQQTISLPGFYIDQTPVTNADYKRFIDANTSQPVPFLDNPVSKSFDWDKDKRTFPVNRGQYPVVLVTWRDANAYCKWAGGRLPTEAEWEKAARGSDGRVYPWGDEWEAGKANTAEGRKGDATPVGEYTTGQSPFGAFDMVGNVWQWTSSLDKPYPYDPNDGREDLQAPGPRIVRGGAWLYGAAFTRTAARNRFDPDGKSLSIGFRCAEN